MSFAFFGTPHFSEIVLKKLLDSGYRPDLVITAPDKPVGRKQILTPSPVKQLAIVHNIPTVETHHDASLPKKQFDYGILAAYGLILPPSLINLFPDGILNIHPSLLPAYRGATPIQTAILNGEKETGVTIIKLNEKIDEGEIVAQEKMKIEPDDTTQTLGSRLFREGANLLIKILPDYLEGKIKLIPQISVGADHGQPKGTPWCTPTAITKKFTKQDGFILPEEIQKTLHGDVELSKKIDRKFRAFTPWPGIWTTLPNGKRMLITKCHLENRVLKIDFVKHEGESEKPYSEDRRQ